MLRIVMPALAAAQAEPLEAALSDSVNTFLILRLASFERVAIHRRKVIFGHD
jgi:hypothetical protein